jgi:hypothetical protein
MEQNPIGPITGLLGLLAHAVTSERLNHKYQDYEDKCDANIQDAPPFGQRLGIFDEGSNDGEHGRD